MKIYIVLCHQVDEESCVEVVFTDKSQADDRAAAENAVNQIQTYFDVVECDVSAEADTVADSQLPLPLMCLPVQARPRHAVMVALNSDRPLDGHLLVAPDGNIYHRIPR